MSNKFLFFVLSCALVLNHVTAVASHCAGIEQAVTLEDTEEFYFAETLGAPFQPVFTGAVQFNNPVLRTQLPYLDTVALFRERFLSSLLLQRLYDQSSCKDKYVCQYSCNLVFPTCNQPKGVIDFTRQVNSTSQQKLAYNWVCKKNLFSSNDQKTSYFSIIFRVLVTSVTQKTEAAFAAANPNADVTKYDTLFIDWNESQGANGNDIAVLRALELYKEGLKGFLLLCSETENGFTQIEQKLDEYEEQASETVDGNNQHEINSDSTAGAEAAVRGWQNVAKAINNVVAKAKASKLSYTQFKLQFGVQTKPTSVSTSFANFKPIDFLPRRDFNNIASILGNKGKNDGNLGDNDYSQRVILYNQLKESLRNSFIEMVQGNLEQRDFCQCGDYSRFFSFFNGLSASEAHRTYGIEQSQLGYQYDYLQNFENICRAACPAESKCPNNGIKLTSGNCKYSLYDINTPQFPLKFSNNQALQFEMGGNDVQVYISTGTRSGSDAYQISLGESRNTKSTLRFGKIGTGLSFTPVSGILAEKPTTFTTRKPFWVTFYDGVIKVGQSSIVGKGEMFSYTVPRTAKSMFTPMIVGFGKKSTYRCDIIDARFELCSGNGHQKGSTCKCFPNFSGSRCEVAPAFAFDLRVNLGVLRGLIGSQQLSRIANFQASKIIGRVTTPITKLTTPTTKIGNPTIIPKVAPKITTPIVTKVIPKVIPKVITPKVIPKIATTVVKKITTPAPVKKTAPPPQAPVKKTIVTPTIKKVVLPKVNLPLRR